MHGSLPKIYSTLKQKKTVGAQDSLRAYAITYLREKIKAEALVRNLQGFQNFIDIAMAQNSYMPLSAGLQLSLLRVTYQDCDLFKKTTLRYPAFWLPLLANLLAYHLPAFSPHRLLQEL